MISLPSGLPPELVPLSWLLGVWEGSGVIDYAVGDDSVQAEFGHRVSFSYDGLPYLNYSSYTWLLEDDSEVGHRPLVSEMGYWRLSRPLTDADAGPAMPKPYRRTKSAASCDVSEPVSRTTHQGEH